MTGKEVGLCMVQLKFYVGFLYSHFYCLLQGVFKPVIYVVVTANVMHVGINTLLIEGVNLGFQYVYI